MQKSVESIGANVLAMFKTLSPGGANGGGGSDGGAASSPGRRKKAATVGGEAAPASPAVRSRTGRAIRRPKQYDEQTSTANGGGGGDGGGDDPGHVGRNRGRGRRRRSSSKRVREARAAARSKSPRGTAVFAAMKVIARGGSVEAARLAASSALVNRGFHDAQVAFDPAQAAIFKLQRTGGLLGDESDLDELDDGDDDEDDDDDDDDDSSLSSSMSSSSGGEGEEGKAVAPVTEGKVAAATLATAKKIMAKNHALVAKRRSPAKRRAASMSSYVDQVQQAGDAAGGGLVVRDRPIDMSLVDASSSGYRICHLWLGGGAEPVAGAASRPQFLDGVRDALAKNREDTTVDRGSLGTAAVPHEPEPREQFDAARFDAMLAGRDDRDKTDNDETNVLQEWKRRASHRRQRLSAKWSGWAHLS